MKIRFTGRFERQYALRSKKFDATRNIWQARVDRRYRFYFQIERDYYILLSVTPHPK